jgi:hypothetical protein
MVNYPKILLPQANQSYPKNLGGPTDPVIDIRPKRSILLVVPNILGHIAVLDPYFGVIKILPFAREEGPSLEKKDPLAAWGKTSG